MRLNTTFVSFKKSLEFYCLFLQIHVAGGKQIHSILPWTHQGMGEFCRFFIYQNDVSVAGSYVDRGLYIGKYPPPGGGGGINMA